MTERGRQTERGREIEGAKREVRRPMTGGWKKTGEERKRED